MKRRDFIHHSAVTLAALAAPGPRFGNCLQKRPNILWLTCEDMSPNLGCYGDPQGQTPHLDRLASSGIRYNRAFSVCPVCAPSRSGIITGVYPSTLGTLHMRSQIELHAPIKCFPEYLRSTGYYCTNNQKEDYNFKTPSTAWDESSGKAHFRNRPDSNQPFFAVFNFTITHESKIGTLPEGLSPNDLALLEGHEPHNPSTIKIPPYYPDTEVIRRHWAHYYDLITAMDRQAGNILHELEEDGLAENTAVFFFSDHGVGAPRGKRTLYDSGTHVPLIIRWPGQIEPGTVSDQPVSFIDLAPTVLSITGISIPQYMQGIPFLGPQKGIPRKFVYFTRDRMDERYDTIRAVRDQRFKYIRNYEPAIPYDQPLTYPESFPIMQELRRVRKESRLKGPQELLFLSHKPLEELYDTLNDPYEVNNIIDNKIYHENLCVLRSEMDRWMIETKDLALIPEFELADWLERGGKPEQNHPTNEYHPLPDNDGFVEIYGRKANDWISDLNNPHPLIRYRGIKALALLGKPAITELVKALKDSDSIVAYWAGRGLGEIRDLSESALSSLEETLQRSETGSRLGAGYALVKHGRTDLVLPVAVKLMSEENAYTRLAAFELLELIGLQNEQTAEAIRKALDDKSDYLVRRAKWILGIPAR